MPNMNGTGPNGAGPRTGRGLGSCGVEGNQQAAGATANTFNMHGPRAGMGLGRGMGRGFGRNSCLSTMYKMGRKI
jgi:hypothetical protein